MSKEIIFPDPRDYETVQPDYPWDKEVRTVKLNLTEEDAQAFRFAYFGLDRPGCEPVAMPPKGFKYERE